MEKQLEKLESKYSAVDAGFVRLFIEKEITFGTQSEMMRIPGFMKWSQAQEKKKAQGISTEVDSEALSPEEQLMMIELAKVRVRAAYVTEETEIFDEDGMAEFEKGLVFKKKEIGRIMNGLSSAKVMEAIASTGNAEKKTKSKKTGSSK